LRQRRLYKVLRHAGDRPNSAVRVLVFIYDITERSLINALRIECFSEHRPASTLVDPYMKVKIEDVAYVGIAER
jgi:hypothetical protein